MISVNLGYVPLTMRQKLRMSELHDGNIMSFYETGDNVIVTVFRDISETEKDQIRERLKALEDTPLPYEVEKEKYQNHEIKKLSEIGVDSWIDNNVTDLNSAKIVLKKIVNYLVLLSKRVKG